MAERSKREQNALQQVGKIDDPTRLRRLMANAKRENATEVYDAAFRRLCHIQPAEKPGTVEHALWQTIFAFEEILSDERGRTTRLARTRQKVARVGERKVLEDFALNPTSTSGFDMLIERDLPELTGEAIVLQFAAEFDAPVVRAAKARLAAAGVDCGTLISQESRNG